MVDLHTFQYPEAERTNLPTDQTERFMKEEDYQDGSFQPERMDNSSHPFLHWDRREKQDSSHTVPSTSTRRSCPRPWSSPPSRMTDS